MMQPSISTKYYYIENYPNGDSLKSEIAPENLDELGKNEKGSLAKQKHRSDSLFYAIIPLVLHYEVGYVNDKFDRGGETNMGITQPFLWFCIMKVALLMTQLTEVERQIWV